MRNSFGTVTASAGTIGGWTLENGYMYSGTTGLVGSAASAGTDIVFYAGSTYSNKANALFKVTKGGALTSTSGTIGG